MVQIRLTYSVMASRLFGQIEGPLSGGITKLDMKAVSGGRAGSTQVRPDPLLANNANASWIKSTGKIGAAAHKEGGPIPIGQYRLLRPGTRGQHGWIPIEPTMHFALGRSDLYIHPEGPHGSDGCIVVSKSDYATLRSLLTSSPATPAHSNFVGELEVVELMPELKTRMLKL